MERKIIKVGITQGDINGIGYEVIIKTLMDPRMLEICTPIVYGSPKVFAYYRKALNIVNFSLNSIRSADEALPKKAYIINCLDDNVKVEIGQVTSAGGEAAAISLKRATDELKAGKIDVLVTAPINKQNIQSKDFNFPGHTEYLAKKFDTENYLMLLACDRIKVGLVTSHVPIAEVPKLITKENILNKLRIINDSLKKDFAVIKPKIAVLSLNPHCGDSGLLGTEEKNIIIPAVEQAREEKILATGPYAADGFFGCGAHIKFDAILAMYHDQGLAPFKAIAFEEGVNYTAGLPFIRTSPAHGVGYDIAGKGVADESSFRQALYMACDIFHNRKVYAEINKNPLPFSNDKAKDS
ncbi:MAG: 4-hydroxythreonine-4-phosphate dehydrogenase PdxA [Bacteroidetes bacterium RIFOXYA12_FULL_35_11]|nr:MAG: 4-hydroxythreonine-4-phosphate dehydrogenase PdxA [Bacteroidetes bacterium GWF2_35_48]OFY75503.1 MAG: 4-hydroxythreonine-4-phosphate dehydrogenase PdxA [Bacteroidetes bacterium RIFOXYA12_FULL_35_11]OFZ03941.1 MAG: 4-hydroxythreonine-4-phosphate dehydrogenase PdxA [Bacteroidetes bacterium RIFOXYC12_FULL_35_7]HBX52846.1 4-hydroxythreonine-4-phosphate dehydrogenase PdxA [Bacteroidales bacterium]